jgi:hypothetical protein
MEHLFIHLRLETLFRSRISATNGSGFVAFGTGNVTLHPVCLRLQVGKIFPTDGEPNGVSVSLSPAAASRPAGGSMLLHRTCLMVTAFHSAFIGKIFHLKATASKRPGAHRPSRLATDFGLRRGGFVPILGKSRPFSTQTEQNGDHQKAAGERFGGMVTCQKGFLGGPRRLKKGFCLRRAAVGRCTPVG